MSISISGGASGITIETDPTALKLTGGTLSGTLFLPTARNLLNTDLNIVAYNDTGAGTTYTHSFKPFDGTFQLAANGGGLRFPDSTVQATAGLPLTGGTLTGKLNCTVVGGVAGINLGTGGTDAASTIPGDLWLQAGSSYLNFRDGSGVWRNCLVNNNANTIDVNTATTTALRITQRGAGEALRVEDSTNPDSSAFIINNEGNVAIGYPDGTINFSRLTIKGLAGASRAVTIDAGVGTSGKGIAIFGLTGESALDIYTGSASFAGGVRVGNIAPILINSITAPIVDTGTYNREIPITIDGVNYRIPCRQV
jgi:hypothetical protein